MKFIGEKFHIYQFTHEMLLNMEYLVKYIQLLEHIQRRATEYILLYLAILVLTLFFVHVVIVKNHLMYRIMIICNYFFII